MRSLKGAFMTQLLIRLFIRRPNSPQDPRVRAAYGNLASLVGMACNICSFNLSELCAATVALLKDPEADIAAIMPAPDFVGGGNILYDAAEMASIYKTGRGSVRVRGTWVYNKEENMVEVNHIPPTTTLEAIIDKVSDLTREGKIKLYSALQNAEME